MAYLNITAAARQWSANLHSHVFCAENAFALRGRSDRSMSRAAKRWSCISAAIPMRGLPVVVRWRGDL
jgi:hypothetical protein